MWSHREKSLRKKYSPPPPMGPSVPTPNNWYKVTNILKFSNPIRSILIAIFAICIKFPLICWVTWMNEFWLLLRIECYHIPNSFLSRFSGYKTNTNILCPAKYINVPLKYYLCPAFFLAEVGMYAIGLSTDISAAPKRKCTIGMDSVRRPSVHAKSLVNIDNTVDSA